jgi:alkaline phosphatase D
MSSLRPPGRGPIVGHTTTTSCRVWIRAEDPGDQGTELDENRRTIGVIAVIEENGKAIPKRNREVHYFRLHREFDRTGTFNLGVDSSVGAAQSSAKLKPNTDYVVRVGTLTIDDPFPNDESVSDETLARRLPRPNEADWFSDLLKLNAETSEARFKTFPEKTDGLSFILGSCRYPGLLWKVKEADQIFGPLWLEAQGKGPPIAGDPVVRGPARFVLMVGDQIYADMLNRNIPLARADTFAEFQERYLTAYDSRNMRALLRQTPNYMILDDHEIEDNWTQDRISKAESREVFNLAISAYLSYQWSHGPRTYGRRLFYQFECGGYPFFVLDTRTQRYVDDRPDSLDDNHLLGRPSLEPLVEPSQLDILLRWLKESDKNIPKFIVSASVFVPNPLSAREGRDGTVEQKSKWKEDSDSWPAFPKTRQPILHCIVDNTIQNVIFLSGDIHCSNVAQMIFSGTPLAKTIKAFSVTSSAFYWPFPFADGDPSGYVHDSTQPEQQDGFQVTDNVTMNYTAWNFTQEDNYCRLDIDRANHTLTVRSFDKRGNLIEQGSWVPWSNKVPLIATLQLAPW